MDRNSINFPLSTFAMATSIEASFHEQLLKNKVSDKHVLIIEQERIFCVTCVKETHIYDMFDSIKRGHVSNCHGGLDKTTRITTPGVVVKPILSKESNSFQPICLKLKIDCKIYMD